MSATSYAWFSCEAGASGDMFLGALVDAGAALPVIQQAVDALDVERIELWAEPTTRGGISATKVHVDAPTSDVVRTWPNVRGLLEQARLPDPVRARALGVFTRLALSEGKAHRTSPEHVHFHEVGALDALADIVGTCAALHDLGVTSAGAGTITLGSGFVRAAHGVLPVPVPAVLSVLADANAPVQAGPAAYEMCTPTGAALLAETVRTWGPMPPLRLAVSGTGAGGRELTELPNVLRVVLGQPAAAAPIATDSVVLDANVDDLDPRLWPHVLAQLLAAGADDAWLTPILMKKGRPAHTVSVLAPVSAATGLFEVLARETTTLGVRETPVGRRRVDRAFRTVSVRGQDIRVKLGLWQGEVINAQPEYEDVAAAAAALGAPVKAILAEAVAAGHEPPS